MVLLAWIVGIITGALCIKFLPVLKKMDWYFGLLAVVWYGFGVFAATFAQVSFAEGEPQAGYMAIGLFGGIFVILGVVLYVFGIKKAKQKLDHTKINASL